MSISRHKAFADLQPARVVVVLALVAVGAFLAEHIRPGHHVHVGPDGLRHHHHAFVGDHEHDEDSATATAHAHVHEDSEQGHDDHEPGVPPEAPGIQALLTTSALMTPDAPMSFDVSFALVTALFATRFSLPVERRVRRAGGPRAPPR